MLEKRRRTVRLHDDNGSVRVDSIRMEMLIEDTSNDHRDREYVNKMCGEINIELWSDTKVVDFHIGSKPIDSELNRFSTNRTINILNDLPAIINDRMKELYLDIEQWLAESIQRDVHERK